MVEIMHGPGRADAVGGDAPGEASGHFVFDLDPVEDPAAEGGSGDAGEDDHDGGQGWDAADLFRDAHGDGAGYGFRGQREDDRGIGAQQLGDTDGAPDGG